MNYTHIYHVIPRLFSSNIFFKIVQDLLKFNYNKPVILLLLFANISKGQNSFNVEISFNPCFKEKRFIFKYDDGIEKKQANSILKDGKYFISGKYFSKYATLEITDIETNYLKYFWIGSKNSKIIFLDCDTTQKPNMWKNYSLENAVDFKIFDHNFYFSCMQEEINLRDFNEFLQIQFRNGDSLIYSNENQKILIQKKKIIYNKQIAYFKAHINEYYSFWRFKELLPSMIEMEADTLFKLFNLFPKKFKESFEGKRVKQSLYGKTQKVGSVALNFSAVDILDKPITLNDFRGEYVMLIFWATWCGPCVSEIPDIKKIRQKYPQSLLQIISVSEDDDKDKLLRFIEYNKMDWIHIFGNKELISDFGVWAIPKSILIDKNGIIIFMDEGNNLDALQKKLDERILN